jgi:hypothetical protein
MTSTIVEATSIKLTTSDTVDTSSGALDIDPGGDINDTTYEYNGGSTLLTTGSGGKGGDISFLAGVGASVTVSAGNGYGTSGGDCRVTSGEGGLDGRSGGSMYLSSGSSSDTGTVSGNVTVSSGGSLGGTGGNVTITAGVGDTLNGKLIFSASGIKSHWPINTSAPTVGQRIKVFSSVASTNLLAWSV